jgi:alkylated DNA repair dioxygenase AlkB
MANKYRSGSNWLNADTWAFINSLSFKDYILAGNSVANLSAGIPLQGDLDFWVQYKDDYISVLHEMMPFYDHMNIYPSMVELYNEAGMLPRVNLILTCMTPQETIDSFDLDYCRCYWTPATGIVYSEYCKACIDTKIIKHLHWDIIPKRIVKALRYGYQFPNDYFRYRGYLLKPNSRRQINPKPRTQTIINITDDVDIDQQINSTPFTFDDLDLDQFKEETVTLSITDINDIEKTLHELATQYEDLLYDEDREKPVELPILLSFTDCQANKNLIDRYVTAIILINPMSEARYQDIRLGENFVQRYRREEHVVVSDNDGMSCDDMDRNYFLDRCHPDEAVNNSTYSWDDWNSVPEQPSIPKSVVLQEQSIKEITPICSQYQIIQLNESGTAFISIDHLPDGLSILANAGFNEIYALHPQDKHKIIMYENEVPVHRYSKSYLNTPCDLSHTVTRSYMYSGLTTDENMDPLPDLLVPFYNYIKTIDPKYNQVICNWYENQNDYIAPHADCQRQMIANAKIALLSLYDDDNYRILEITPKAGTRSLADKFVIKLTHGSIVTMCGTTQNEFMHGIPVHPTKYGRRVSISFRQMSD